MKLKPLIFSASFSLASSGLAALPSGQVPPEIKLEGKLGGKVKGGAWSSTELVGKVHVLFYVAPSAEKLNQKARDTLK